MKNDSGKHELDMSYRRACSNIKCLQLDKDGATERKAICSLDGENWRAQRYFEKDENRLRD